MKNNIITAIVFLVAGIIIGLLLAKPAKESIKTEYKYIVKERVDTLKIDNPKVVYKDRVKNTTTVRVDSVYKEFKPSDYSYKLDTVSTKFEAHLEGWGGLNKVNIISKHRDSIIEKTVTKTLLVNKSTLYLWGGYSFKPSYQAGVDYTIKNIIILGGAIDYDRELGKTTPMVKIGIKIK
jgi:hypothetical protein